MANHDKGSIHDILARWWNAGAPLAGNTWDDLTEAAKEAAAGKNTTESALPALTTKAIDALVAWQRVGKPGYGPRFNELADAADALVDKADAEYVAMLNAIARKGIV